MKRFVSLFLILTLWLGAAAGLAEEDGLEPEAETAGIGAEEAVSAQEDQETRALDEVDESQYIVTGKVYEEKTLADFNRNSPALYRGMQRDGYGGLYSQKEATRENSISYASGNVYEDILYVGLQWMIVRRDDGNIGYVKREYMAKSTIEAVDPVNTPPFNAQKHTWIATTAKACHVRKTMDKTATEEDDGNNWVILKPGTRISIWQFYDGWAMVNYMRSYGYIDPEELKDLIPVAPTDTELYPDSPIAAYTSYYKMVQTENNISRISNIKIGCALVSVVLEPGEQFDGNEIMGPYGPSRGYKPAIVMKDGKDVLGYGGGTCQVSSTLYNAVRQLPGLRVDWRRPHGANGATYLPIHCDAAVGTDRQNFKFTNMYDFPIRIEGCTSSDGALSMRIYKVHE